MGGSESGGGGSYTADICTFPEHASLCRDPDHSEPFACSREAEGGWVCEAQLELEKSQFIAGYLYDALGPANDDIWEMAQDAWKSHQRFGDVQATAEEKAAKYDIEYDSHD